jgi:sirohydrochlorin ferrochelatase
MEAILYICHGSRVPAACEEAISFIRGCMNHRPEVIQEYCFLELADPTIEAAYEKCVQRGATSILAVPVLLLTAAHAKKDIPDLLYEIARQFPDVTLKYGNPIGVHPKMIDILTERITETGERITSESLVLVVGRGSSDPDVKRDLREITKLLSIKLNGARVEDCYLTAAEPSFQATLENSRYSGADSVFVIPYLLFTGILMKGLAKEITHITETTKQNYVLCDYLGYHPNIKMILDERITELKKEISYVSDYT